jgi:hypothetical protein
MHSRLSAFGKKATRSVTEKIKSKYFYVENSRWIMYKM